MTEEQTTETLDLLDGTPFRSIRVLGEGGMGFVLEAVHRTTGQPMAVKLLHANFASDDLFIDRLRVEGEVLQYLKSPHVVTMSECGWTSQGDAFIAMELLAGRSLAAEITARGAIPVDEAIEWSRQALRGIAAAHTIGIVHRDLKPANLFVCPADQGGGSIIKVLDFGVAKVLSNADSPVGPPKVATSEGVVIGSPRTMSPEACRCDAVDARSDIYSMGIVLYMMVAGRGPFDHKRGLIEYVKAHVFEEPRKPSELSPQPVPAPLDGLILRALAKDRAGRFRSASEFEAALAQLARSRGTLSPSAGTPPATSAPVITKPVEPAASARKGRGHTMKMDVVAPARSHDSPVVVRPPSPPAMVLHDPARAKNASVTWSTGWVIFGAVIAFAILGSLALLALRAGGLL